MACGLDVWECVRMMGNRSLRSAQCKCLLLAAQQNTELMRGGGDGIEDGTSRGGVRASQPTRCAVKWGTAWEAGWEEGTHRGGVRALENVLPWNAVRPEIIAWVLSRLAAGEHPQERESGGGRETRTQRVDACVWCVFQATSA